MNRRTFNKLAGLAGIGEIIGPRASADAQARAEMPMASNSAWNRYFIGTAYYPEWWEPSEWEVDFRQMQEVGITAVRMGEFAWAMFEPSPGKFEFQWMDHAVTVANHYGVSVILGTPTASVPPWLCQLHPDSLSADAKGAYTYGGRKSYNTNSPNYLDACARIVTALAEHYGSHPGVIGWQLDNEPSYPLDRYDPDSKRAFQEWLRKKYGTLDALNRAWNGAFWSNMYTDWSQIDFPTNSAEGGWQPANTLAYREFFSDSVLNYLGRQASILRKICKNQFISTNWPGIAGAIDVFAAAEQFLTTTAWDNYVILPGISDFSQQYIAGFNHDFSRCAGPHQRFFCAEQIAYVPAGVPEEGLRLQAYINLAHGSHGHLYFEWRRPLAGGEQYRPSFIKAFDGSIPEKTLFQRVSKEFAGLDSPLAGAVTRADIALLYSFDNSWSQGFAGIGPRGRSYNGEEGYFYNGFKALQRNIDVVPVLRSFAEYKLIVAPNLHMVDDSTAKRLHAFVSGGGTLMLNYGAGTQNMDASMRRVLSPGVFRGMVGVTAAAHSADFVEYPQLDNEGFGINFSGNETVFHPHTILESLTLEGAETIATFRGGSMQGRPAVTRHRYGQGWVFYVGTDSTDGGFYESLARIVGQAAGLSPLIAAPYGVEVVSRENDQSTFYFLLNLTGDAHPSIRLPQPMGDMISGTRRVSEISLEPFGVAVLSAAKTG